MSEKWRIVYTRDALKDKQKSYESGFKDRIEKLLAVLEEDPYMAYPPYEKLIGDLLGMYSRRINVQHRLVYSVHEDVKTVKILSLWLHYE